MTRSVLCASALIVIGGAAAGYLRYAEALPDREPSFDRVPLQAGGFTGEERRFSDESYDILQADTSILRLYTDDHGTAVWLFVGYFGSQKYGSQIHSPKHCLPGSGWKIVRIEPYDLEIPGAGHRRVNRLVIAEREHLDLMFYWYETRGGVIRNEFGLKWDLMVNSLFLRPTDAALIRLNLPLRGYDDIDAGSLRALGFLEHFLPAVEQALPFGD